MPPTVERAEIESADRAVTERKPSGLPDPLRAGYDAFMSAYAHYEAGRDEEMREELRKIGLRSPFAEWRLMLRGLSAWSRSDDEGAREAWHRLDHSRAPAKLISPMRSAIDADFLGAQDARAKAALEKRLAKLTGPRSGLTSPLISLRDELRKHGPLSKAFQVAKSLVPKLQKEHPDLAERVCHCLYWAILRDGNPDDIKRYRKAIGEPAFDPEFSRLEGMAYDRVGEFRESHPRWAKYADWLRANADRWPDGQAALARAMVHHKMGLNAQEHLTRDELMSIGGLPEAMAEIFGGRMMRPVPPKPLKPSAEQCFKTAMDLAPEWPPPAVSLMAEFVDSDAKAKAKKLAPVLEERFPGNLPALAVLVDYHLNAGDLPKAVTLLTEMQRLDPLSKEVRFRLGRLALSWGHQRGQDGDLKGCREQIAGNLENMDPVAARAGRVCLAVLERQAGNEEAAESYLNKVRESRGVIPALTFHELAEVIRFKIPKPAKQEADKRFKEVLAGPLNARELALMLFALDYYLSEPTPYHGLKTHDKKIREAVKKVTESEAEEWDWVTLGLVLQRLRDWKLLKLTADHAGRKFKRNGYFPYLAAEAACGKSPRADFRQLPLFRKAEAFAAEAVASGDQRFRDLLEVVRGRIREMNEDRGFGPFGFDEEDY